MMLKSKLTGARKSRRGSTLMMTLIYVLMFGALASSMVSFSQGNVMVEQSDRDTKTALMAAESGMSFLLQRLGTVSLPTIKEGSIANMVSPNTATTLWAGTTIEGITNNSGIAISLANALNSSGAWASGVTGAPAPTGINPLTTAAIPLDPANSTATFSLAVTWDSGNPYTITGTGTSVAKLHLTSTGQSNLVSRSVAMDVWIQKKLNYAVYSNVAIQLGKNVHIIGDIGSTYASTGKGPPVQMFSDLHYLPNSGNIDTALATLRGLLATYDSQHVNRLSLATPGVAAAAAAAGLSDVNGDGYIDEYDVALQKFGAKVNPGAADQWGITAANFTNPITGKSYDGDLFTLDDSPLGTQSTPPWAGYGDNVVDYQDNLPKVTGNIKMAIPYSSWTSAASGWSQYGDTTGSTAGTNFNDQFEGTVSSTSSTPVQFGVDFTAQQTLTPQNFDTSAYLSQSGTSAGTPSGSTTAPIPNGGTVSNLTLTAAMANGIAGPTTTEHTPADVTSGWQATLSRPVFQNVTFNNVQIPTGLNAKFINCTFNGYTTVRMNTNITAPGSTTTTTDPNNGMSWAQQTIGTGTTFSADGIVTTTGSGRHIVTQTNPMTPSNSVGAAQGNNLHFSGCTINGPITADTPTAYTAFANSWEFDSYTNPTTNVTTNTTFNNTVDPTVTILAPNTNIEMGSFLNPGGNPTTLVGVVVAGNLDVRGSANFDGSVIVTGAGAQNTTLGYFGSTDQGQGVPPPSQLPAAANGGYGHLFFRLNSNRGMPNGISIPVVATAQYSTYQIQ
jgi:hypothetical protein